MKENETFIMFFLGAVKWVALITWIVVILIFATIGFLATLNGFLSIS